MMRFLRDESGQTTVEYALFIAVLVAVILGIGRGISARIIALAKSDILPRLTQGFFPGAGNRDSMYRYRI